MEYDHETTQKWVKVAIKVSTFPEEKTACPSCGYKELRITDIPLSSDCSTFERLIYCPSCHEHGSLRAHGKKNYRKCKHELSEGEQQIVNDIKAASEFASRAAR